MAPQQRDPEDGPHPSLTSTDTVVTPPLGTRTPSSRPGRSSEPSLPSNADQGVEPGDFTEPATFSLHPPRPSPPRSLPPPVPAAPVRPSRPIAVPLDTTALPPLPAVLAPSTVAPKAHALDQPLLSIVAFAIMVSAAATPLTRYLGVFEEQLPAVHAQPPLTRLRSAEPAPKQDGTEPPPTATAPVKTAHELRVSQLAELDRDMPNEPGAATAWLVNAARERREAGDVALAELMLARALEHDEDNPEVAFGFAQVRKVQGNLEGAEGWVLKAMRLQPRKAIYRAFYAELRRSHGKTRHPPTRAPERKAPKR